MKKEKFKEIVWDFVYDIIGALLFNIGVFCFAVNAKFAPVGISGLSVILNHLYGLPMGITSIAMNIPVILISYKILGKRFLFKSAKTMLVFAILLDLVVSKFPMYSGNPFYAAICTGVFSGLGLTIIYYRGASSGGTDFLIMAIRKLFPHLSIGQITWGIDGAVVLIGGLVFHNIDAVMLGIFATVATTIVIDKIMYGLGAGKLLFIVTDCGEAVAKGIGDMTGRGATFLSGQGSYSRDDKQVVMCACNNRQVVAIRKAVHEIDKNVFLIITESNEVFGQGFKPMDETLSNSY